MTEATHNSIASVSPEPNQAVALPSLVIVGRPNVGKSTLFNRLTGSRRSIVTDEPGITRDRIYGRSTWRNRPFEVVDTGGLIPEDRAAIPQEILRQADVAIADATILVMVVDVRAGLTPLDAELARRLRRTGKPLVIAVNKVDSATSEVLAAAFHELGADIFPISAERGSGVDDLLDAVTRDFPLAAAEAPEAPEDFAAPESDAAVESDDQAPAEAPAPAKEPAEVQVAIIGRPNVGKSTLLNALTGDERSIVSAEPGTTRDAVDANVIRNGHAYRFIDTAGIRRKGKTTQLAEKLSVVMARKHLERADVALLIADASAGVSAGDATIAGYAHQSGRSVIIVLNKWDLAIEAAKRAAQVARKNSDSNTRVYQERSGSRHGAYAKAQTGKQAAAQLRKSAASRAETKRAAGRAPDRNAPITSESLVTEYEPLIREKLKFLSYAPIVFISALTGSHLDRLYAAIDRVARNRRRRISTGELNRWLASVDLSRGTSPTSRKVKIFYVTQASTSPPTFILFTNQRKRLHFSYERFLESRLREKFDFTGSPIRFLQRVRDRSKDTRERALTGPPRRRRT